MFFAHQNSLKGNIFVYIAVFLLVFFGYFIGQFPLIFAVGIDNLDAFQVNPDFTLYGIDSNIGFILMILMFVCATLALWAGIAILHKGKMQSIIRPQSKIDFKKILWAFGFWFGLTMLIELMMWLPASEKYALQFDLSKFLPLLLISLFILPIQTSFEELFFRGYLMQGIGKGLNSKLAGLIITSLLFGLIHITNPEVGKYGLGIMMAYYITAGLALGIMTIMDDGLELALGVHAATNIYGALIVSYEGSAIQTASIFKTEEVNPFLMFGISLIAFAAFLLIAKNKFHWGSFNKLKSSVYNERNHLA